MCCRYRSPTARRPRGAGRPAWDGKCSAQSRSCASQSIWFATTTIGWLMSRRSSSLVCSMPVCPGWGTMGFAAASSFWLSNLYFDIRSGRRKPRNGDFRNKFMCCKNVAIVRLRASRPDPPEKEKPLDVANRQCGKGLKSFSRPTIYTAVYHLNTRYCEIRTAVHNPCRGRWEMPIGYPCGRRRVTDHSGAWVSRLYLT